MEDVIYLEDIKKKEILYIEYLKEDNLYKVNFDRAYIVIDKQQFKEFFTKFNLLKIRKYYINKENLKYLKYEYNSEKEKWIHFFNTVYFDGGKEKDIRILDLTDKELEKIEAYIT